jgi:N-acetylglucosamine-6-phosphate deacetylase
VTTTLATTRLCPPGPPAPGWLVLDGPVIAEIGWGTPKDRPTGLVDVGDALVAPGFVDLQVNGLGSIDLATADAPEWEVAGRALVRTGTTAYCPTLVSAPLTSYPDALARAAAAHAAPGTGAAILGVHLEGPFLGGAPGAHPVEFLRAADAEWLDALLDQHPGLVRIVTLAPEADPELGTTRLLVARGVIVALGHSTASFEEATAAVDAGATLVTHLFNGMAPFHHRAPGLAGAALADPRLTASVIADLVHVHAAALTAAIAAKPKLALVTDAVALTAGAVGDVELVDGDGAVRRADGTLAGSTVPLDQAVRNVVALGVPVERAVEMAATIPAAVLGVRDRGRLVAGARADLVVLDPESLAVLEVWVAGERVLPIAAG